jgi:DNA-binding NarL/FixJ family response regulator
MSTTPIQTRLTVSLHSDDPVSRAGVAAQLAKQGIAVTDDGEGRSDAAVVVADEVNETVERQVRRLRGVGVRGIVLVVAHLDDRQLFAAVEAGVSALLRRSEVTPVRLEVAIQDARAGNGVMPPDLVGRLIEQIRDLHEQILAPRGMSLTGLSDREIDVLRLVADGCSTSEIAKQMAYSERTIKNIIQGATTRLQLRNRSHAVAYALRQGLI